MAVAALLLLLPALAIIRLYRERRATLARLLIHGATGGAVSGLVVVALAAMNRAVTLTNVAKVVVPVSTALLGGAVATVVILLVGAFRQPVPPVAPRSHDTAP